MKPAPVVAAGYAATALRLDARRRLAGVVRDFVEQSGNTPEVRAALRRALDGLSADLEARHVQMVGEAEVVAEIKAKAEEVET